MKKIKSFAALFVVAHIYLFAACWTAHWARGQWGQDYGSVVGMAELLAGVFGFILAAGLIVSEEDAK